MIIRRELLKLNQRILLLENTVEFFRKEIIDLKKSRNVQDAQFLFEAMVKVTARKHGKESKLYSGEIVIERKSLLGLAEERVLVKVYKKRRVMQ